METSQLIQLAQQQLQKLGYTIRLESLQSDEPYRTVSGDCQIGQQKILIIDDQLSPLDTLDILIAILKRESTQHLYLPPILRQLVDE